MMENKRIFPVSVLEQTSNQIFNDKSKLSGIIYMGVLLIILVTFIAAFFVRIDVNVQVSGIIKPKEDHVIIASPSGGFASIRTLSPNVHVNKGDTLLTVKSELLTSKLPALLQRKTELEAITADLRNITTKSPYSVNLQSPMYKQDVLYYIAEWNEADSKRNQAKAVYERSKQLYDSDVIPLSEFEPAEFEYNQAQNAIIKLENFQKRQWQSDLITYETELMDIETQINQIEISDAETVICSPVTGTIHNVQSLFNNSYIASGQQIAEISPDGDLIVECYINPKDIGLIKTGMEGRIKVLAYNYNEWGVLRATISEIFDDVTVSADGTESYYKIYCTLDSDYLTLTNGYKGSVKKGMVVNGNFIVTRRTVFQLLYDKIDNWMNPNNMAGNE